MTHLEKKVESSGRTQGIRDCIAQLKKLAAGSRVEDVRGIEANIRELEAMLPKKGKAATKPAKKSAGKGKSSRGPKKDETKGLLTPSGGGTDGGEAK